MSYRLVFLFLTLTLHCAATYTVRKTKLEHEKPLYLIEPVFMSDLLRTANPKDQFERNLFVGEIFFSGPMETDSRGFVQSKSHRFTGGGEYAKHIMAEARSAIVTTRSGVNIKNTNLRAETLPLNVETSLPLKKNAADGTDNMNLPRIAYNLVWKKDREKKIPPGYYLIPVVEYYYGHTGGWFNGQTFGCGAGARMAVAAYIFDSESGETVFMFSDSRRTISEYQFRSDSVQMTQELAELETVVLGNLRKELKSL